MAGSNEAASWWRRNPDRLRQELEALRRRGLHHACTSQPDDDVLRLAVTWAAPCGGEPLELSVAFPEHYPWFPPMVSASATQPLRHREPFTGQLCLLAATSDWDPATVLVEHLDRQVPRLLEANGEVPVPALELPTPEPVTASMRARWPCLVLTDGAWQFEIEAGRGTLELSCTQYGSLELAGHISRVLADDGTVLARARPWPLLAVTEETTLPWARVEIPAADVDAEQLWHSAARHISCDPGRLDRGRTEVLGALVREETRYRQSGDSFILVLRSRKDRRRRWEYGVVLTEPAGPGDLALRTPETVELAGRRVLVCGVGALGGPLALELARAGLGRLDLVDGDHVTAGTVTRQVPGLQHLDLPKPFALGLEVMQRAPFCDVRGHAWHVGGPRPPDRDGVLSLLAASDLVVDCAAEPMVTRFLAAHARSIGTPLLVASATAGAWGGSVVRLPARGRGCWRCLELHRADYAVPWPTSKSEGTIQPVGCSESTFTGAAFELAPIWQLTVAAAVDQLLDRRGDFADVHVLSQRTNEGMPAVPRWRALPLHPHAGCPGHTDEVQLPLFAS